MAQIHVKLGSMLLVVTALWCAPRTPARATGPATQPAIASIVERTNDFRRENGCGRLEIEDQLTSAAQSFAEFMARTEKFGHEADNRQPADRATAAGYKICLISENIAYRFKSREFTVEELSQSFVEGWINSPPHRKNMLAPNVVQIGVGLARNEKGVYYGVQLFGRPESMKIKFSVINRATRRVQLLLDEQKVDLPRGAIIEHAVCEPVRLRVEGAVKGGDVVVDRKSAFVISEDRDGLKVRRGGP